LGGTYFGPAVAGALRGEFARPGARGTLTDREREILQLVARGQSTKEIAATLGISAKTADNHRTNLMRKLDLHEVASLTRHAIDSGLLEERRSAS
jgi:DNA-binding NarL/FixJ family response regulator